MSRRIESPGYNAVGTDGNYARKMMELAGSGLGEANAIVREAKKLTRTTREIPLGESSSDRRIHSLEDVTRGLGLDSGDEQRVQALIRDTPANFDSKTYPKMTGAVAKISMALRRTWNIPQDARSEILKRAQSYYRNTQLTGYDKKPSLRYELTEKSMRSMSAEGPRLIIRKAVDPNRPPQGFMAVPKSKKGGFKSPDGKQYWYPDGRGVRGAPDQEDQAQASSAKPDPQDAPVKQPGGSNVAPKGSKVTPPKGAQGGPPPVPQDAADKPGAGASAKPMSFTAPPQGASPSDQEMHHRGEHAKAIAAFKMARKNGDQEGMRAAQEAGRQHAEAASKLIRDNAQAFAQGQGDDVINPQEQAKPAAQPPPIPPDAQKPQGGPPAPPQGEGQAQPPPVPQNAQQTPPQGSQGTPPQGQAPGGNDAALTGDPVAGLERTSSGVTVGEDGQRVTAANPHPRAVPEAELVRQTRERLGRALNVMADLSAAHSDLSDQQNKYAAWKKSDHPMRKQALATLKAAMAQSQADITQLEAAHAEAMKAVTESQAQMQQMKMKPNPIFQSFMEIMGKIGSAAGELLNDAGGALVPEKSAKEKGEAAAKMLGQANPKLGEMEPEQNAGAQVPQLSPRDKKRAQVLTSPLADPRVKQAQDVLARLGANDEPEEVSDADIEEVDPSSRMRVSSLQGKEESDRLQAAEDEKNAKMRSTIDSLEEQGRFTSSKEENPLERKKQALARRGDNDEKSTAISGVRRKDGEQEDKKTVARGMRKSMFVIPLKKQEPITLGRIVKSQAWQLAMEVGLEAKAELRKSASPRRSVLTVKQERRVPFFFHEL